MTQYVIYESNRPGNQRSAPILASDQKSRQILEGDGWYVVSEYDGGEAVSDDELIGLPVAEVEVVEAADQAQGDEGEATEETPEEQAAPVVKPAAKSKR